MHFVDNIDFVAGRRRAVMHRINDLADVGDAGVRGRVHLHHINVAAFHDRSAVLADTARIGCRPAVAVRPDAVHPLGDDPRRGGLTGAANARHHKSLRDPVGCECVLERADHGILADEIGEGFGPVFAGQNAVGGCICHGAPDRIRSRP